MQRSRPWMRAMPSPTLSTVPTSATSMSAVNPPSCSRRILVISSARISMLRPSSGLLVSSSWRKGRGSRRRDAGSGRRAASRTVPS